MCYRSMILTENKTRGVTFGAEFKKVNNSAAPFASIKSIFFRVAEILEFLYSHASCPFDGGGPGTMGSDWPTHAFWGQNRPIFIS